MDTWQYVGKNVKVTFVDGIVIEGYVSSAETEANSGRDGYASLDIESDVNTVLAYEDEIKSIEIVS